MQQSSLPLMIPPIPTRPLSLQLPILNREPITENPGLRHRDPEQFPTITRARPQLLARVMHTLPLTLELEFTGLL